MKKFNLIIGTILAILLLSAAAVRIFNGDVIIRGNLRVDDYLYYGIGTVSETGTTVYISDYSGDDLDGDGTESNPYKTTEGLAKAIAGVVPYGVDSRLTIHYDTGTYKAEDVFPYLRKIDLYFTTAYVIGTPIYLDTINITHPGTATRNYYIFDTDSTIVGDQSGNYISIASLPAGYEYGFPIAENTSSQIIMPATNLGAGATRKIYRNGTIFTVASSSSLRVDRVSFFNISFRQEAGSDGDFDFSYSNVLQLFSCDFVNDQAVYGMMGLVGVRKGTYQNCYFDWTATSKNGDIAELNLGDHAFWECVFQGNNSIALGGGSALEARPGVGNIDISHVVVKDLPVAVKCDGGNQVSVGSFYTDNVTTVFDMFDPRVHWIGQADRNIWQAGYDSIICHNTTNLLGLHAEYSAGHTIYIPTLKAGGYTNFESSGVFENLTSDFVNTYNIAVGDGVRTVKIDTLRVNNIIYEDTYWDDLRVPLTNTRINPANSEPDFEDRGDGLYAWGFDAGNDSTWVLNFIAQSPHKRKDATDFEAHLHWQPGDNNVGDVVWKLIYSISGVNGTFSAPETLRVVATTTGDSDSHQLIDFGDITGTDLGISTMIIGSISRMGDATDDTYTGTAYGLEIDFHYQIDSPGSHEEYIK